MTYMLVRRLSDGKFLCKIGGWVFTSEILDAVMYESEEYAHRMAQTATDHKHPSEVVYPEITLSNVRS